jgi:hypothetical protein
VCDILHASRRGFRPGTAASFHVFDGALGAAALDFGAERGFDFAMTCSNIAGVGRSREIPKLSLLGQMTIETQQTANQADKIEMKVRLDDDALPASLYRIHYKVAGANIGWLEYQPGDHIHVDAPALVIANPH